MKATNYVVFSNHNAGYITRFERDGSFTTGSLDAALTWTKSEADEVAAHVRNAEVMSTEEAAAFDAAQ